MRENWVDRTFIGFNRKHFIDEILNERFMGRFEPCAKAIGMNTNYLHDVVMNEGRDMGIHSLTKIYRYCVKNGLKAERYIFVDGDGRR